MMRAVALVLVTGVAWGVDLTPCSNALRTGRYAEARKLCEQAARDFAAAKDLRGESNATNLVGNALLRLGELEGAREQYRKATELARRGGDDEGVALRLNNLGGVDYFQGRYEDAERNYAEAAAWIAARASAEWAAQAALTTAVNQATLLQRLGRDRAALDEYLKLRAQAKRLRGEDEGRMLANMGALYRSLGDPYRARELYGEALARFRVAKSAHGVSGALKNLGIAEAVEFRNYGEARRLFEQVLRMAAESGNRREQLLAELYLAETAFREAKWEEAERRWRESVAVAVETKAAEEEWRGLFGLGRVAEARGGDGGQWYAKSIAKIESLRQQTSRGAARGEFLATKRDVYDARIRRLLRGGRVTDALLDTMERSRARGVADEEFRVTAKGVQERLPAGETLVVFWVSGTEKAAVWLSKSGMGMADLRKGWFGGVPVGERLIVVPDGGLEMEPVERGIDADVVFLPAVRMLGRQGQMAAEGGVLVAGPGLAHAKEEIREVKALFPARWAEAGTGKAALEAMRQAAVIHIAAHAVPDYEREERSRILLEDGPLLLRDIAKTKLRSALVTLSACQTGAGRQVRGEGIQSLAGAFLLAGAESVVASRRPVDDGATRSFMAQFYAALAQGETKAGALRTAKRRLKESGGELAKAEHWEPWMLFGDGRSRVASAGWQWRWAAWAAALVAAAAAAIVRRVRPAK